MCSIETLPSEPVLKRMQRIRLNYFIAEVVITFDGDPSGFGCQNHKTGYVYFYKVVQIAVAIFVIKSPVLIEREFQNEGTPVPVGPAVYVFVNDLIKGHRDESAEKLWIVLLQCPDDDKSLVRWGIRSQWNDTGLFDTKISMVQLYSWPCFSAFACITLTALEFLCGHPESNGTAKRPLRNIEVTLGGMKAIALLPKHG